MATWLKPGSWTTGRRAECRQSHDEPADRTRVIAPIADVFASPHGDEPASIELAIHRLLRLHTEDRGIDLEKPRCRAMGRAAAWAALDVKCPALDIR
jgi:hypothetical protein